MNREQRRAAERAGKTGRSSPIKSRTVWQKVDPLAHAISRASIPTPKQRDELSLLELSSLDAFTRGAATIAEWSDLVNACNIAQTLAGKGIGREAMPDLLRAEEALLEAAHRYEATARMGLTGPGIQAMRTMLEWHDAQREVITVKQYSEALRLTDARIRSGYATVDLTPQLKAHRDGQAA